jgi:nucleoside-diphosphate-sugar epimerase
VGEVVNVGSGKEISVGELAELLIEVSGQDAKVVTDETRLRPTGSEVERLLCDTTKCQELTGWSAKVGLREGLQRTSDWVRDHQPREQALRYQV